MHLMYPIFQNYRLYSINKNITNQTLKLYKLDNYAMGYKEI